MIKNMEHVFEEGAEKHPTVGEIKEVFDKIVEGAYEEVRIKEDENGLYLLEVRVEFEGGYEEYSYMREGNYPEGGSLEDAIHVVYFDEEGIPCGGKCLARYEDGEWSINN